MEIACQNSHNYPKNQPFYLTPSISDLHRNGIKLERRQRGRGGQWHTWTIALIFGSARWEFWLLYLTTCYGSEYCSMGIYMNSLSIMSKIQG